MVTTRKRSSKVPEPTAEDEAKNTKSIQERRSTDDESEQEDKNDETKEGEAEISEEQIQHAIALASAAASKKFGWDKITNQQSSSSNSNPLSEIIPGYVAPLSLDSSSLDKYKTSSQRNALGNSSSSKSSKSPFLHNSSSKAFKKTKPDPADIAKSKTNAGSGWFHFEATPYTAEIQADIAVIRNRNFLDPKKFYKSSDFGKKGSHSKMVQLGTVVEGAMESVFSNRLSKKERKANVMEEVMGEVYGSKDDYVKRKYTKMQKEKKSAQKRKGGHIGKGNFRKKKVW